MLKDKVKAQKAFMLVELIDSYYELNPTGGSVHIITDDGNYEDSAIDHCIWYAKTKKDYWGECIAKALQEFNLNERKQIVENPTEITNHFRM
jgi:hypothetical protein